MEDANKIICRECLKPIDVEEYLSHIKGKRGIICRECYNARKKELYHHKNPFAEKRIFNEDDFHCSKCGELKEPREFLYVKGRRQGICKKCYNARRRELFQLKNPLAKTKDPSKEKFRCAKCGELRSYDDYYYHKSGRKAGLRRMPCKFCANLRTKNYRNLIDKNKQIARLRWQRAHITRADLSKQADKILRALENQEKVPVSPLLKPIKKEVDYGKFKLLSGSYKICPQCGLKKRMADFSDTNAALLRMPGQLYIIEYRQIYSECSECRNRFHALFDRFIYESY